MIEITAKELLALDEAMKEFGYYQSAYGDDVIKQLSKLQHKLLTITDSQNLADYHQHSESEG